MRIPDGYGEQLRHTEHLYLRTGTLERDRIANYQLFQYAVLDIRISITAQHRMRTQRPHTPCPLLLQETRRFCQRPSRITDVIDKDDILIRYIPDHHHARYFVS